MKAPRSSRSYGDLNAHLIGIAMKEMVRRAIYVIRKERFTFEAKMKRGYSGEMDDIVTSADKAAQKMYVKLLREQFPTFGIIAEEDGLHIPCTNPRFPDTTFTVDPLDGTKAMARRQSHGIGTMISLVCGNEVIAACVGDVMTQEVYYFRPESKRVWRLSEFDRGEQLRIRPGQNAHDLHLLLRKRPEEHASTAARALARRFAKGGLFKDIEITGGSIGVSMARLWKGEVGAAIVGSPHETPWDANPVIGITEKLGFVFCPLNNLLALDGVPAKRLPLREVTHASSGYEFLVVHQTMVPQLMAWAAEHRDVLLAAA